MQVTDFLKEFDAELERMDESRNDMIQTSDARLEEIYEERRRIEESLKQNREALKDAVKEWLNKSEGEKKNDL